MATRTGSYRVKPTAIIQLIGLSSISQCQAFHDSAGIYIPTGPKPPHSVSGEVHAFWWNQFSYLVLRRDRGWADDCNDVFNSVWKCTLHVGLSIHLPSVSFLFLFLLLKFFPKV